MNVHLDPVLRSQVPGKNIKFRSFSVSFVTTRALLGGWDGVSWKTKMTSYSHSQSAQWYCWRSILARTVSTPLPHRNRCKHLPSFLYVPGLCSTCYMMYCKTQGVQEWVLHLWTPLICTEKSGAHKNATPGTKKMYSQQTWRVCAKSYSPDEVEWPFPAFQPPSCPRTLVPDLHLLDARCYANELWRCLVSSLVPFYCKDNTVEI